MQKTYKFEMLQIGGKDFKTSKQRPNSSLTLDNGDRVLEVAIIEWGVFCVNFYYAIDGEKHSSKTLIFSKTGMVLIYFIFISH
jgi:hypothetical protein